VSNGRDALFKMFQCKHFMVFVMSVHLSVRVQQPHIHWTYFRGIL